MQDKLKIFKGLNNMEKVFAIKDLMPEFIHFYDKARTSMEHLSMALVERRSNNLEGDLNGKPSNGSHKNNEDYKN